MAHTIVYTAHTHMHTHHTPNKRDVACFVCARKLCNTGPRCRFYRCAERKAMSVHNICVRRRFSNKLRSLHVETYATHFENQFSMLCASPHRTSTSKSTSTIWYILNIVCSMYYRLYSLRYIVIPNTVSIEHWVVSTERCEISRATLLRRAYTRTCVPQMHTTRFQSSVCCRFRWTRFFIVSYSSSASWVPHWSYLHR